MLRLGFLLLATSVLAQSQIQQLNEVVLSAQRINSPISPLSITLVSDSLNGLLQQEIGEQLGIVPSLFVSSQQNFTQDTRISIRGFGTRAAFGIRGVKILLDGIPISTPDGQAQLDHIPISQLGSIEVIRGLSSGLYGNASGGVLLLKSAPITNEKQLIATLGSFALKTIEASISESSEKNKFRAIIAHKKQEGYREWSAYENNLVSLSNEMLLSNSKLLTLDYSFFTSPLGRDAGGLTLEQVSEKRSQARAANMNYKSGERVKQHYIAARLKHKSWNSYAFYTNRTLDALLPFSNSGQIDLGRNYFGLGTRWDGGKNHWIWQYGLEGGVQLDDRKRFNNELGTKGLQTLDQKEQFYSVGAYGIVEIQLHTWRLRGSVRSDFHRIRLVDSFGSNSGRKNLSALSPMAAIHHQLSRTISSYLRWSTGFETPSLNELSANPTGDTGFNTMLNPQKSNELELGFAFKKRNLTASLTLFRTTTKDEILPYELIAFPSQTFYANIGRVQRNGIEFEGSWAIEKTAHLSLAFSHGIYETENTLDLPNVPNNQFAAAIQKRFGKTIVSINVNYLGSRYINSENSVSVPSFWKSDLYAQQTYKKATLTVGASNLTNTRYYDNIRINAFGGRYYEPGAERQYYVRLQYAL